MHPGGHDATVQLGTLHRTGHEQAVHERLDHEQAPHEPPSTSSRRWPPRPATTRRPSSSVPR
ncbi:hypothetical protein ACFQ1I_24305 [Kitasatospora arboriphila]